MTKKQQHTNGENISKYFSQIEIDALIDYRRLKKEEPFLNKSEQINTHK